MIDHLSIGVSDLARAKPFYDAIMAALGAAVQMDFPPRAAGYGRDGKPSLWIAQPETGAALTGWGHIALVAASRAQVDAFHAAGLAAGGTDNGAPGIRLHYHPNYYAAFIVDPDGNRLEAVCHQPA